MGAIKKFWFHVLILCLLVFWGIPDWSMAGKGIANVISLTDNDKARLFYYALEDAINNPSIENLENVYTNLNMAEKTAIDEKIGHFHNSGLAIESKTGRSILERLLIKPTIGNMKDSILSSTAEITYQANGYLSTRSFPLEFIKTNNTLKLRNGPQILDSVNSYIDSERNNISNKNIPDPDSTLGGVDFDTLHVVSDYYSDNMLAPILFCSIDLSWPLGQVDIERFTKTVSRECFNGNIIAGLPANGLGIRLDDEEIQAADHEVVMIADPAWNRIIIRDLIEEWDMPFGSYGSGIYNFKQPQSMAYVYDYFIVADAYNFRASAYRFYSDENYEHFQFIQNNNGCVKDVAAAWYEDLSKHVAVLDFDNARVDLYTLVNYIGNPQFELDYSLFGCESGYFCLKRPTSLCYGRLYNQTKDASAIYITDGGNQRVLYRHLISDSLYLLNYEFPENSYLTSIDVDYFGNSYVVDKYNCHIYKFDRQRDLLGVYGSRGEGDKQLLYPLSINVGKTWKSGAAGMWHDPTGDIVINEYFSENTGLRRYLPGVDILWTSQYTDHWSTPTQCCRLWAFWHQTETAKCHKKLYYNDILIYNFGTEIVLADDIIYDYLDFDLDTLSDGLYTYEVKVKSYFNTNDTTLRFDRYIAHPAVPQSISCDSCGGYQGAQINIYWDSVDVTGASHFDIFRNDSFLVSVPSTKTNYVDRDFETGGVYKYKVRSRWESDWYSDFTAIDSTIPSGYPPNAPSKLTIARNPYNCGWVLSWQDNSDNEKFFRVNIRCTYPGGSVQVTSTEAPANATSLDYWNDIEGTYMEFYAFAIDSNNCHHCTFEEPYGCYLRSPHSNLATAVVGICMPPTCPYLYVWNGRKYQIENNLLAVSNAYKNLDSNLVEYHVIEVTPEPLNGSLRLFVSEMGADVSTFDQLGLFMIDNSAGNDLYLDKAARAYAITENQKPARVTDHLGNDITDLMTSDDGSVYYSGTPGYFIAEYEGLSARDPDKIPVDGGIISDPPIKGATSNMVKDSGDEELIHNRLYLYVDYKGEWLPVDTVHALAFRHRDCYTSLKDYVNEDGTLRLKYEWTVMYSVDNIGYAETEKLTCEPVGLPLKQARHSKYGDITSVLTRVDGVESSLLSGDTISLAFAAPSNTDLADKVLILAVTGRYSSEVPSFAREAETKKADSVLLPVSFAFDQNYPNPFNPATTFEFALPRTSHVTLDIYNILGRKVESVIDDEYQAGYHSVTWSGDDLGSGVYFAKFRAGDFASTRKVVIVK